MLPWADSLQKDRERHRDEGAETAWPHGEAETSAQNFSISPGKPKGEAVREREHKRTLPRKGLFGKVLAERWRLFNDLCMPFSPIARRFSGKLSCTTLNMRAERLTVGSSSFGKIPAYKYLK
jgi:hypothetical protein